jgi:hypothetical protein
MSKSSTTDRTGPVIFSRAKPRAQLREEGRVVTFRTSNRTTGDTWWRTARTAPKEGDCHIRHLKVVGRNALGMLAPHVDASGFDSLADWSIAIRQLHPLPAGENLPPGFLYEVTTR